MSVRINTFSLRDDNLIENKVTTLDIIFNVPVLELDLDDFSSEHVSLSNLSTLDNGQTWTIEVTPESSYEGLGHIALVSNSYISSIDYSNGDGYVYNLDIDTISPDAPTISFEDPGTDGIYNTDEVGTDGTITATVEVPTGTQIGDTLTIDGADYPVTQDTIDNGQQVEVAPGTQVTAVVTDSAGNTGDPATDTAPSCDVDGPDDTTTQLVIDAITDDNTLNAAESATVIAVTGSVSGEFVAGDEVTLTIDGKPFTGPVAADGSFSIEVPGSDLAADADTTIDAQVVATDAAGNTGTITTTKGYAVDTSIPGDVDEDKDTDDNDDDGTTLDGAPIITFPEDTSADGILNATENGTTTDTTPVRISLPANTEVGDTVVVTLDDAQPQQIVVTAAALTDGYVQVLAPITADTTEVKAEAFVKDAAGNQSNTASESLTVDTTAPDAPTISFEDPGTDGIYNTDEVGTDGTITATVEVPTGTQIGDTLTIDGADYPVTQDTIDNGQQVEVTPGTQVTAVVTDSAGNTGDPATDTAPNSDTDGPNDDSTQLVIDAITDDNTLNAAESATVIAVTGSVSGEFAAGDEVTLTINGKPFTGLVAADGSFSIEVPGSDLAADADTTIDAQVVATDAAGNTGTITTTKGYAVDTSIPGDVDEDKDTDDNDDDGTTLDGAPIITFPEDTSADGILNATENGTTTDTTPVRISLPANTEVGDTVVVTLDDAQPQQIVVTAAALTNGYVQVLAPITADTTEVKAEAFVKDAAGNQSNTAAESLAVDTTAPDAPTISFEDPGADGIYNTDEVGTDGTITATVEVPTGTQVGDTLTIDGVDYPVTQDTLDNGQQVEVTPGTQVTAVVTDSAGNTGDPATDTAPNSDTDGPNDDSTQLVIDAITDDNTVNAAESATVIAVTGSVSGEFVAGDEVTLTINGNAFTGLVAADGSFSIEVPGSDLAADADTTIDAQVVATDAAGNTGTITAVKAYCVDTEGPTLATTQITMDTITADDIINAEEAGQQILVTGTVTGEFTAGDEVTLTVNGNAFTGLVAADGTFNVEVPGSDLAADSDTTVDVVLEATDSAGNTAPLATIKAYEVDTVALAPTVVITEDTNNDGILSYLESDGDIDFTVTVADDAKVGDTLTVDGQDITITQAIIDNGYQGSYPTIDGDQLEVAATVTDQVGNTSPVAQDAVVVDLTIPDAAPIYLWHLGANLTDSQGPSDQRGKYGGQYGDEFNYETGILNDYIYIGYEGFDNQGELIISPWDGDFERDSEDGDAVWTMETYAGHDYIHIREDQNAYTVAKLGSGDDTYYVQGEMDSVLGKAQNDPDARSYLYTESGDDTVVVGGNGEGKVTGWGIDGGRIFTGSGSDSATVYGEMDDGGVIDLGAGHTEYANPNEVNNANTVDSTNDVNHLTITHNLGNAGNTDFGRVYGGMGDDHVDIGTYVEGTSEIDLGEGNNTVSIGDDLDGESKVITGSGDDKLNIGDDTEDWSSIDLGNGNNAITILSTVEDHSTINTGSGNDTLEVGYKITNSSQVDLGEGNNSINVGNDIEGYSTVTTGSGDDVLNIGDDTEDSSVIDLGDGDNVITVFDALEDHSVIKTGVGNDTLSVGGSTWNHASVQLGEGDNTVTISGSMYGESNLSLGAGEDQITVGGMHNHSVIEAGSGDDTIVFNGSKLSGTISGGEGKDTLVLTYNINDDLVNQNQHETNVSTEDFNGIEVIEMTGQNVVDIRYSDLVEDSSRESALFIKGDENSKVDLGSTNWNSDGESKAKLDDATGGDWEQINSTTIDGINFNIYHNSQADNVNNDVYIEQGITII